MQGHVDGVGEVVGVRPEGDAEIWDLLGARVGAALRRRERQRVRGRHQPHPRLRRRGPSFTVSILPAHDGGNEPQGARVGDQVNLEADVIGKYVERLLEPWLDKEVANIREESERCRLAR